MLARTALRLIAVAALEGRTIAEDRVDDSRMGALAPETVADDAKAVIIAIADDDDGEAWSEQNGGPPFDRLIDLNFELAMKSRVQYVNPDDPADSIYVVEAPDTDARLEASLDFLEFQTIRELAFGLSPYAVKFRQLARITHRACHRAATDDGIKIASRILTLKCRINDDQIDVITDGTVPVGLDALPEPLRSVAKLLPADSSGGMICAALAAAMTQLTLNAPLRGFDIRADARDHVPAPDPTSAEVLITIDLPQP
jgi:hypothetical protein